MMMDVTLVKDESSYQQAIADIHALWGAPSDTPEGDYLDVMMTLVEAYERRAHSMGLPDPIEAIKLRMNNLGWLQADLCRVLGVSSARASAILDRHRPLTIEMVRVLAQELGLSEVCLIQPYDLLPTKSRVQTPDAG